MRNSNPPVHSPSTTNRSCLYHGDLKPSKDSISLQDNSKLMSVAAACLVLGHLQDSCRQPIKQNALHVIACTPAVQQDSCVILTHQLQQVLLQLQLLKTCALQLSTPFRSQHQTQT